MSKAKQPDRTEPLSDTIVRELDRHPRLDATRIRVRAEAGRVALGGSVRSYSEKCCAESIARELDGVVGVYNAIEVRLSAGNYRTDEVLAQLTNELLENHAVFSSAVPRALVRDGWVVLSGVVPTEFHKTRAPALVCELAGVRGITNEIQVRPRPDAARARQRFEAALKRHGGSGSGSWERSSPVRVSSDTRAS